MSTYRLCALLLLTSSVGWVDAKPGPSPSTKDPFQVKGGTNGNNGLGACVTNPGGTTTASAGSTTSANRPIAGNYYPSFLGVKAVLVFTTLAGSTRLVSQSDFETTETGNQSALTARTTYEFGCLEFQNLYTVALGYGFHKALPSSDDPSPSKNTTVYSDITGGSYTFQPW